MTTLFLSPRYTDDSRIMRRVALALGWQVERLTRWVPPPLPEGELVVYGETIFCRFLAEHLKLALLEPSDDWLPGLPYEATRRHILGMEAAEARAMTGTWFVKPVNDKLFPATVTEDVAGLLGEVEGDAFVLLSEPVHFTEEYRFFVREGRVMTGSRYLVAGELALGEFSTEARDFAQDWTRGLPAGVVLDVGWIEGRGWAVVEANPAWGSGLYEADPVEVLGVLAACCGRIHAQS